MIPEIDQVRFFGLDEARRVINVAQVALLDRLVIVTPVVGRVTQDSQGPTYFGDLRVGTFGTEPPPIEE